jgi:hypothetical protein
MEKRFLTHESPPDETPESVDDRGSPGSIILTAGIRKTRKRPPRAYR